MSMLFKAAENHWINVINKSRDSLNSLSNKKDIQITSKFINLLELIIKYENLRLEDQKVNIPVKRLIKVHRNIPVKILEFLKQEYIIFDGLYIVADVMFIDPNIVSKFSSNPKEYMREELGLSNDIDLNTLKIITDSHNNQFGIGIIKSEITTNYIQFPTKWSYPDFSRIN